MLPLLSSSLLLIPTILLLIAMGKIFCGLIIYSRFLFVIIALNGCIICSFW
jgi:hypothetical protein